MGQRLRSSIVSDDDDGGGGGGNDDSDGSNMKLPWPLTFRISLDDIHLKEEPTDDGFPTEILDLDNSKESLMFVFDETLQEDHHGDGSVVKVIGRSDNFNLKIRFNLWFILRLIYFTII